MRPGSLTGAEAAQSGRPRPIHQVSFWALAPLVGGLTPPILAAGIGAAILRYRLYDLDRIISRTLAYGLLSLLLGGGYALVVLGLGQLLGRESPLVVAAATLAVAALFQPARHRIQAVVDRRFNRRRHDAARIIEGFGTRLRDQVDLDTLTAEVLAVVDQTMQPTQASLWLRPPGSASQDQRIPGASRAAWQLATPRWWWPGRPWRWPRCSDRPAATSRPRSTAASTAAATTPPRGSPRSVIACASRSTWTP